MWKWALAAASTLCAFVLTIAVDRVASLVLPRREALVFPPDSRFRLKTSEFDFEANVNSLGFRDRPFHAGSSSVTRIVAIGDSFTYGWGVQDSEPWPKALERDLLARGMAVEIANLGRPGAGPDQYLRIAQAAVPVLKPRWIIVGLLQGDDLNQSTSHAAPEEGSVLKILFPTLSQLSSESPVVITADETRKKWQRQAREFVARLEPAERQRFESLDPAIRVRFLRGDLNPDILALSTRTPQYSSWLLNKSGDVVQRKIAAMAEQLVRIRRLAERYGAHLLVVSVPNWPYVSQSRSRQKLGFILTREMLSTEAPDDEMRQACRAAGIDRFISVTNEIRRRAADGAALYFPADGHFTPEGQQAFADALSARVWPILSNQRT